MAVTYLLAFLTCKITMSVHSCTLKGHKVCDGGGGGGGAVQLGEGRATVPIFRPVNKLQKQMDLGAEIHLAPLE